MTPTSCVATRRCAGWSATGRQWVGCLGQPDGPLRDEVAGTAGEPRRPRSAGRVDRRGAQAAATEDHRARHGFERKPDLGEQEGSAYNEYFGCTCLTRCSCSTNLVRGAGWAAQSQAVEPEDALQVGKQHLDLLPLTAGLKILGRAGQPPGDVARLLMHAPWHLAAALSGTAPGLEGACHTRCRR